MMRAIVMNQSQSGRMFAVIFARGVVVCSDCRLKGKKKWRKQSFVNKHLSVQSTVYSVLLRYAMESDV